MSPAPMTTDQLRFFSEQTDRAVTKATRRTLRTAFVGYVILFAGIMGMYFNGQHVSNAEQQTIVRSGTAVAVDSCNRDYRRDRQFISLLQRLKSANEAVYKQSKGAIPADRYQQAQDFYTGEITRAKDQLPDCRDAQHTLTDDPNADLSRIKPLHP